MLVAFTTLALASPPTWLENEPNNAIEQWEAIEAPATLLGHKGPSDQDGFWWTVSPEDAARDWTFRLNGVPGAITRVDLFRVEVAPNGREATGVETVYTLGSRDGSRQVVRDDLVFEPGLYTLGVSFGGGGAGYSPPVAKIDLDAIESGPDVRTDPGAGPPWSLALEATDPQTVNDCAKHAARDTPLRLDEGRMSRWCHGQAVTWGSLTLPEGAADSLWTLRAHTSLERPATVTILDPAGVTLTTGKTDTSGKLVLEDLGLGPGSWLVKVEGKTLSGGRIRMGAFRTGARLTSAEVEPNKWASRANQINVGPTYTGTHNGRGDLDFFTFTVDEALAETPLTVTVDSPSARVTLLRDKAALQVRNTGVPIALEDLLLPEGRYLLKVEGRKADTPYSMQIRPQERLPEGHDAEPNDEGQLLATTLPEVPRPGRLVAGDTDVHAFTFTDAQRWRLMIVPDSEDAPDVEVKIQRPRGSDQSRRLSGSRRVLSGLFVTPGTTTVTLSGKPQGYTLKWIPLGPATDKVELEPNGGPPDEFVNALAEDATREGVLEPGDTDCFAFTLHQTQRVAIEVRAPLDGPVDFDLHQARLEDNRHHQVLVAAGESESLERTLRPATYRTCVQPARKEPPPEGEYVIGWRVVDPVPETTDREPNNAPSRASLVPASLTFSGTTNGALEGSSSRPDREDYWRLPDGVSGRMTVTLDGPGSQRLALVHGTERSKHQWIKHPGSSLPREPEDPEERRRLAFDLPADTSPLYLWLDRGRGPYEVSLVFEDGPEPVRPAGPLHLDANTTSPTLAGFYDHGQQIEGTWTLRNEGDAAALITLDAQASTPGWNVTFEPSTPELGPGTTGSGTWRAEVPPDQPSDRPLHLALFARSGDTEAVHRLTLTPRDGHPPVEPRVHWEVPQEVLGAINIAPLSRSLSPDEDHKVLYDDLLNFEPHGWGFPNLARGLGNDQETLDRQPHIAFPGDEPLQVVAVSLEPLLANGRNISVRDFLVELSLDGKTYTEAGRGSLDGSYQEQVFVLPEPVSARFARLRPITRDGDNLGTNASRLSEWKVLVTPGMGVLGDAVNLADHDRGGHISGLGGDDSRYLEPSKKAKSAEGPALLPFSLGFHHSRAARVARITWADHADCTPENRPRTVQIEASLGGSVGPWTPLGTLTRNDPTEPFAPLEVDGAWVRYLKFTTDEDPERTQTCYPDVLTVIEVPERKDYRSILGEWGKASSAGPYEWQDPPALTADPVAFRDGVQALKTGQSATGVVQRGVHVDRYTVVVGKDHNTLRFQLTGEPTVAVVPEVRGPDGQVIPVREDELARTPRTATWEATVRPGETYDVTIVEPPASVIYTWDTSGSTGPFHPAIFQSVLQLADVMEPGQEAVNLLPFGGDLLFHQWLAHPELVRERISAYRKTRDSSDMMGALTEATGALDGRHGTRAIILLTDGAAPPDTRAWSGLARNQPRIFAIGVTEAGAFSGNPPQSMDGLQDLSWINHGTYDYAVSTSDVAHVLARSLAKIRLPVSYSVVADTRWVEPPKPGTLAVVPPTEGEDLTAGAIEIIFDASGSMFKKLDGQFRIDVARELVAEVATAAIPPETPVAMRVFGHREPKSCRTDLEIPLGPLDAEAFAATVAAIEPQKLSRTPLADSLRAVATDLAEVTGRRTILLLTDGQETCGGDPAEAVAELAAKGIDVQVNVVGLALKSKWKSAFEDLAAQTDGRYLDAPDAASLRAALEEALTLQYVVYDERGRPAGSGAVGGQPLSLMPGTYTVTVSLAQPKTFTVTIPDGKDVVLEVK